MSRWVESGQAPLLFLSSKAVLDGSKAIRGGAMAAAAAAARRTHRPRAQAFP